LSIGCLSMLLVFNIRFFFLLRVFTLTFPSAAVQES
jgi:hypothetical protein